MNIKIIFVVIVLFLTTSVFGMDVCEEYLNPNAQCQMITPPIDCSTYTILNQTKTVTTGNLILINESIYYFVFNLTEGEYVVKLCDNSTREIYVKGEDDMAGLAVILVVFGITSFLVWLGFKIEIKDNAGKTSVLATFILRRCAWVLACGTMAFNMGLLADVATLGGLDINKEIFSYMWIMLWTLYIMMMWLVLGTILQAVKLAKQIREEFKYG